MVKTLCSKFPTWILHDRYDNESLKIVVSWTSTDANLQPIRTIQSVILKSSSMTEGHIVHTRASRLYLCSGREHVPESKLICCYEVFLRIWSIWGVPPKFRRHRLELITAFGQIARCIGKRLSVDGAPKLAINLNNIQNAINVSTWHSMLHSWKPTSSTTWVSHSQKY